LRSDWQVLDGPQRRPHYLRPEWSWPPATINIGGNLVVETVTGFSEAFGPTGLEQIQRKHRALKSFGTLFKTQGDCGSFLATHGNSSPT
jgi:hypothetical protein